MTYQLWISLSSVYHTDFLGILTTIAIFFCFYESSLGDKDILLNILVPFKKK